MWMTRIWKTTTAMCSYDHDVGGWTQKTAVALLCSSAMIIMLSSWNLNIATVVLSLLKQIDCMLLCVCSEIDDRWAECISDFP